MKNRKYLVAFVVVITILTAGAASASASTPKWSQFFSFDQMRSLRKTISGSVRGNLEKGQGDWKGVVSGSAIKDETIKDGDIATDAGISYSKLALAGKITLADLASNSCTNGQVFKYNGTTWACADDSSSLGSTIESSEITDGTIATADLADSAITTAKIANGTIVDADISSSAAINPTKIDFSNIQTSLSLGDVSHNIMLYIDSQLKLAKLASAPTVCTTGNEGLIYYDSTDHSLKVCNGTSFSDALSSLGSTVESSEITDGTIATADLADSAITTAKIENNTIVDADINGSAMISPSKIDFSTATRVKFSTKTLSDTCDTNNKGVVLYDNTNSTLTVCNGTDWKIVTITAVP